MTTLVWLSWEFGLSEVSMAGAYKQREARCGISAVKSGGKD